MAGKIRSFVDEFVSCTQVPNATVEVGLVMVPFIRHLPATYDIFTDDFSFTLGRVFNAVKSLLLFPLQ